MIICLCYKARCGKDTTANYLVNNFDFIQESFAYPLKEYIGRQICGFTDKELFGEWKERVNPEWGKTPRQMLQLIGTDALRDVVHKDFWVIPMRRKLKKHKLNKSNVVISDGRFLSELKMVKDMGGVIVNIKRDERNKISSEKHKSELELENYTDWDYEIDNNGTIENLYKETEKMFAYFDKIKNKEE